MLCFPLLPKIFVRLFIPSTKGQRGCPASDVWSPKLAQNRHRKYLMTTNDEVSLICRDSMYIRRINQSNVRGNEHMEPSPLPATKQFSK